MNTMLFSQLFPSGQRLEIVQGDITSEKVDAIVNAANEMLAHGGGLAAIIARKGGAVVNRESRAWVRRHGPVSHAEPAYTSGGNLPAKYIIHAVGPVWGSGDEDAKLAAAVQGALKTAENLNLGTIALPAISTGIFGFPKPRAAGVIYHAIEAYFNGNPESKVGTVRLTLFDQATVDAFLREL